MLESECKAWKRIVSRNYSEAKVLALTIYAEARSGGEAGMRDVGWVVLNRARKGLINKALAKRFGGTVKEVCLKKWQFSCWNIVGESGSNFLEMYTKGCIPSKELKEKVFVNKEWIKAIEIGKEMIRGFLSKNRALYMMQDTTSTSDHYHTHESKPRWSKGRTAAYRNRDHLFFNDIP